MRALPLLLLFLLAGPAAAQPESGTPTGCKEDRTTCQEDCSIEYGSSTRTYKQLGSCLATCNYKYDKCREAYLALQKQKKLGIEPPARSTTPVPPEEPGPRAPSAESASEGGTAPSPGDESAAPAEPGVRRGVYRASEGAEPEPDKGSEPKTPAKPEPEPKPAETTTSPEEPLVDEAPPPPPPKPMPAPKRPQPPPDPKKKDISDWDPDGK